MTPDATPPGPEPRRPRDLALLLLAAGAEPPRDRPRDQRADTIGGELRRRVLDELAARDPEPSAIEGCLAAIVEAIGPPTGPTRAVASSLLGDWAGVRDAPALWGFLVAEALSAGTAPAGRKRRREAPPDA